jgi:hypothetical protein
MEASFAKLKDGAWGLRVTGGTPTSGQTLRVVKRDGTTVTKRVGKVVWSSRGVTLTTIDENGNGRDVYSGATSQSQAKSSSTPQPQYRPAVNRKAGYCDDCGTLVPAGQGILGDREVDEDMDDFGRAHRGGGRYYVLCSDRTGCQARCAANKAAAVERAKAAKAAAAEKAKADAAVTAAYNATLAAATAGLVQVAEIGPDPMPAGQGEQIAYDPNGMYRRSLRRFDDGADVVYCESVNGYDDYRTYWYMPAATARATCLKYAAARGIDAAQAREWLAKYAGCHGDAVYKYVVEAAGGKEVAS